MALEIQVDPKMWSLEAVPSNSHFQIIPRKFKGAQWNTAHQKYTASPIYNLKFSNTHIFLRF